jgi:hypothetical protein
MSAAATKAARFRAPAGLVQLYAALDDLHSQRKFEILIAGGATLILILAADLEAWLDGLAGG